MTSEKSVLSKLIVPILMILVLTLAGCGPKSKVSVATNAGVVTYENYLNIKLDTTYDDVKAILGEGTKKEIDADNLRYTWEEQEKNIVIQTNKGKIESKTQSDLGKTTATLTVKQFNQVIEGMTLEQVVAILGPDYREVSTKKSAGAIIKSVIWMMPNSKFVKVKLQDDKVTNKNNFLE